jgi:hypothetical protein
MATASISMLLDAMIFLDMVCAHLRTPNQNTYTFTCLLVLVPASSQQP